MVGRTVVLVGQARCGISGVIGTIFVLAERSPLIGAIVQRDFLANRIFEWYGDVELRQAFIRVRVGMVDGCAGYDCCAELIARSDVLFPEGRFNRKLGVVVFVQ